ncbi:hypothetical protein GCM10010172_66080 [Paractinoplanes ferrugineus]|uniref:Uncharacterized protein n=2 Tax=Paractinoplanes ferrugineus TaxID=113564 RepID=A0A919MB31_9ACTN|nr:hypothetical protein Afe05nite_50710 [Actinoplanes ferrugineus]
MQPYPGMVISYVHREDAVIIDPPGFLAAARAAYRADNPDAGEEDARRAIADVYDAAHALIDRYGSIASEHGEVAAGATPRRRMSGGVGLPPGDRVRDRPDGLSPAGSIGQVAVGEIPSLQDYGCALPDLVDLIVEPLRRAEPG